MISEEQLAVRAKTGDQLAFAALTTRMKPLLFSIVNRRYAWGLDRGDFDQEAVLGLWSAVRSYDLARGVPFHMFVRLAVTRRLDTVVRTAQRKKHSPLNSALSLDHASGDHDDPFHEAIASTRARDPLDIVVDRESLCAVTRVVTQELSPLERESVVGLMNGETYAETEARLAAGPEGSRPGRAQATPVKVIDNALTRARRKVLVALEEQPRPLGAAA